MSPPLMRSGDERGMRRWHSLVLRAFKWQGDIGFARLWESMPDAFWFELGCLILESRGASRVRRLFEVEKVG